MVVVTRSSTDPSTQLSTDDNGQSQNQQYPARLVSVSDRISSFTKTLDTMKDMLDGLTANSEFEKGIKSYLALLHSQVCEARIEQAKLGDEQARLRDELLFRHRNVRESVNDLALNVVKTDQYSRRDTVTVVGLTKPEGGETELDLCNKVADVLSASGVTVTTDDLSVAHRNSRDNRHIKGKVIPPSVTVRFTKISKKDSVLRGYKNFDSSHNKPRDVKVYQSLTTHYSSVRRSIYDFFNSNAKCNDFGNIRAG